MYCEETNGLGRILRKDHEPNNLAVIALGN